ncbi:hypothetical protein COT94_03275 [Candidatus Falkowbacteria bacterium CG10_big_fil_rev_8_21_14_0_10_37_14]|uniref:Phosphoribosyltransferase domain-containing protein n=1 Tax=Candidatus Falkowbacteria bacterium CG10_big_fil_rev_8_21_14_0_10_37_14 TaxID=1974561 RepID=A0A2M6WSZ7_9BACT|nr:MAG: hypothetical protein COT94_03275 [Candidatus Falkowbacteria bacterium CG10_big_fil_rev_8_21_14_0_10_37_14]
MIQVVVTDQIYGCLSEWSSGRGFALPGRGQVDEIVNKSIANIKKYFGSNTKIIKSYSTRELIPLIKGGVVPIFISSELYRELREELIKKRLQYHDFTVSRTRVPGLDGGFWRGHGKLLGRRSNIQEQISRIKFSIGNAPCLIFDDSLGTGKTLLEIKSIFNENNIPVCGFVVANSLREEGFQLGGQPVYSKYHAKNPRTLGIEMKDFFDIYGSGAGFPHGAYRQMSQLDQYRKTISSQKALGEIEKSNLKVKNKKLLNLRLKNIKYFGELENYQWIELFECLEMPEIDLSVASEGRLSYLYPFYNTSYWGLTREEWVSFSYQQHILSIELYELIQKTSHRSVLIKDVPIYCELSENPNIGVVEYLNKIVELIRENEILKL